MLPLLVKICGITSANDAATAIDAGADWIGLNFVSGPRKIDLARAREILSAISEPHRAVALIAVDQGGSTNVPIEELRDLGVRHIQPYGDVTPGVVASLRGEGLEVIYVQPVGAKEALHEFEGFLTRCDDCQPDYVLFDAASPGQPGGTGRQADWATLAVARRDGRFDRWPPALLAGGLTAENVADAIGQVRPAGVDVSTGTESSPGRKDPAKLQAFITAVRDHETF